MGRNRVNLPPHTLQSPSHSSYSYKGINAWTSLKVIVPWAEVKPGDRFQLAVFAINGPMSDPFGSIWFRQAMVEFFR